MLEYALAVAAVIGIYALLAGSYDLVLGYTGMFSVAHGAFFGIGAYASALAMLHSGATFLPALGIAFLAGGLAALIVGWPASRLTGDYLVVASLAFAFIVYQLMLNLTPITRGPMGLPGIPSADLFGYQLTDSWTRTGVIWLVVAASTLLIWRLAYSPFGRALKAIRDDPIAAAACGKSVVRDKVLVFAIAAGLAGVAGALYATYVQFIDPDSFMLDQSFLIVIAVVLGGRGTVWGAFVGAAVIWLIPEALRFVNTAPEIKGPLNQAVYAVLLIVILRFRPQGILGQLGVVRRVPPVTARPPGEMRVGSPPDLQPRR